MKISPRDANQVLRSPSLAAIRGVAIYPDNETAIDATLHGVNATCHRLPFGEEGITDEDLEGLFVTQLTLMQDALFYRDAAKILARPTLLRRIWDHINEADRSTLGLIFEPTLSGLGGNAWPSAVLQNRFVHLEVAAGIPLDA